MHRNMSGFTRMGSGGAHSGIAHLASEDERRQGDHDSAS